jgi:ribosome maturation factor RimP
MAAVSRQRVRDALHPVVTAAGRRSVVRVIVDRDGGVDLDAVADVSRTVSAALDDSDVMGSAPYVLEVSSPGVDRPLTEPRHWRRAVGRMVRVTVTDVGSLTGRVVDADDDKVSFDVDGEAPPVAHADLGPGHIQVEFSREDEARQ